jgi:hypothetical protein
MKDFAKASLTRIGGTRDEDMPQMAELGAELIGHRTEIEFAVACRYEIAHGPRHGIQVNAL